MVYPPWIPEKNEPKTPRTVTGSPFSDNVAAHCLSRRFYHN